MDRDNLDKIIAEAYHSVLLMEETKRKYSKAKFSFRDRNAVLFLKENEKGKLISEIADYLKISRPSATSLIKKLEKNGLVSKTTDPGNERNTIVKITRKGMLFAVYQERYRERMVRVACDGFSEEERRVLYEGLSKLNSFFLTSIEESEEIHK